jgi:AraC-like DNA-binding protein
MKEKRPKVVQELPGFDVLADVLGTLGLRSRLFCRSDVAAPWVMAFPADDLAHFHIVERGGAWLEMEGLRSPSALAPGDLVVVGRRNAYRLVDQPGRKGVEAIQFPPPDPSGRCMLLRQGHGATSVLICGSFSFEEGEDHPLLALLPKVMHLRGGTSQSNVWLESMSRFLITEASAMKPGTQTIVSRLTDILFVQVLRAWLADQPDRPNWLSALNDSRIGPALALIHERPEEAWTVEMLAAKVGLSRSPFTVRFTRLVGESPQAYITRVRMQRAARLLREHDASLGQIALKVGYESESSFSKAFKRQYQKTPGQFRREKHPHPATNVGRPREMAELE